MSIGTRAANSRVTKDFVDNLRLVTGQLAAAFRCPICLREVAPDNVTQDEFPPQALGGTQWVPTCRSCNSSAGSEIETHVDRFLRRQEFNDQYPGHEPWVLTVDGKRVRSAISVDRQSVKVIVREDYPGGDVASAKQQQTFERLLGENWTGAGLQFKPDMKLAYSDRRLDIAWLKAAYLSIFWFLGYRAILRPAYDLVREQIRDPKREVIDLFVGGRLPIHDQREVMAWYVYDPHPAFLVYFQGFSGRRDAAVLVPSPADENLVSYRRLVSVMQPGVRLATAGIPPKTRLRGNDGLTLIEDQTGQTHIVYV